MIIVFHAWKKLKPKMNDLLMKYTVITSICLVFGSLFETVHENKILKTCEKSAVAKSDTKWFICGYINYHRRIWLIEFASETIRTRFGLNLNWISTSLAGKRLPWSLWQLGQNRLHGHLSIRRRRNSSRHRRRRSSSRRRRRHRSSRHHLKILFEI